jgi:hypothetical protein
VSQALPSFLRSVWGTEIKKTDNHLLMPKLESLPRGLEYVMVAESFSSCLLTRSNATWSKWRQDQSNRAMRANEYFGIGLTLLRELLRSEIKLVMSKMFVKMMKMSCSGD